MTIWDLQEMSDEQAKTTLSQMTKNDIKQVIDSCGTSQGKSAIKRSWEKLTGNRYIDQMNYIELKEAAREKLNSEGYEAKILVSLPEAPFSPSADKNMNYGIAYGGILCPLSIEPYIKRATSEKDYGELVSWLASHGGRINFDFLNTGERYTLKWIKKHQKMAKDAGIYLSDDNAVLMLGVTLEPDADMIFSRENFPDLYEKIEYVLQAYLDGKMKLVLD